MAVFDGRHTRTYEAGADLSAGQFRFVTLAADGQVDLATNGAAAVGVLLNEPNAAGRAATVAIAPAGVLVEAGGTITAGDEIAADADGVAITATTGDVVLGYAREDGVSGQIIRVDLISGGNTAA
jgi:regulator of RNase E activity RraA